MKSRFTVARCCCKDDENPGGDCVYLYTVPTTTHNSPLYACDCGDVSLSCLRISPTRELAFFAAGNDGTGINGLTGVDVFVRDDGHCKPGPVGSTLVPTAWFFEQPGPFKTVCFDSVLFKDITICVLNSCLGGSMAGASVAASGCNEPDDESEPVCVSGSGAAGDDGCFKFKVPFDWYGDLTVSVEPPAPPEGETSPYAGKTVVFPDASAGGSYSVEIDPQNGYTCCDLDFRSGPLNPSGRPLAPRGKTLFFVTSGSGVDPGTGETETWEIDVDCDGAACAHSDLLDLTGGPPTVETCPPGDYSDGPWDHWQPPALDAGKVPMLVRIWYDGADWHCRATVYFTVARPPRQPEGCNADPTQQINDYYAWFRDDAICDDAATPKLSIAPDPPLVHATGGDLYAGETTEVTVESTSYTANLNNPVDVTFQFPDVTLKFHGGFRTLKIIDSLTVWEPVE